MRALGLFLLAAVATAGRLSFLVPYRLSECVYQEVTEENSLLFFSVMVISGGNLDISVTLRDPNDEIVFDEKYGHSFRSIARALKTGEYSLCFSNNLGYSPQKHLLVHFELQEDLSARYRARGGIDVGKSDDMLTQSDPIRRHLRTINEGVQNLIDELSVSRARHFSHAEHALKMVTFVDGLGVCMTFLTVLLAAVQYKFMKKRIDKKQLKGRA